MNVQSSNLILRDLNSVAELKQAERLQKDVWGEDDPVDNSDIMLAIQHEGGLVVGAFDNDRMLGFLFAFPTNRPEVQHSHRLAVHPDSRGMGLGLKLKWYQRDWCLERAITLVRWTYDPLRSINAGLNISGLGATAATYHQDYYGKMEGINAGLASDRLLAQWHLSSPSVVARAKDPHKRIDPITPPGALRVAIPSDFSTLLAGNLDKAVDERMRVRKALMDAFAEGYFIADFDKRSREYILTKR